MPRIQHYLICDRCKVAVVNDDYSACDAETVMYIDAMVESVGNVTVTDEVMSGYGDCYFCDETCIDCTYVIGEYRD